MRSLRRWPLPAVLLTLSSCAAAPEPGPPAALTGTEGVGGLALLPAPDTARDAGTVLRLRSAASGYVTAFDFSPGTGLVRRVPAAGDPGAASPRIRPGETALPAAPPLHAPGPGGGRADALTDPGFTPSPTSHLGLDRAPAPGAPGTGGPQRVPDARSTVVVLSARPLTAGEADALAAAVGTAGRAGDLARELARRIEAAAGPVQWTLAPQ
jgi:hypothetical protein